MNNTENSKSWQDNSDGWVKTMTESKEKKEEYQRYLKTVENPVSYRYWLRGKKNEKWLCSNRYDFSI